ncbi:MAG: hypothetical protein ACK5MW_04855 [Enterococcus sp.]
MDITDKIEVETDFSFGNMEKDSKTLKLSVTVTLNTSGKKLLNTVVTSFFESEKDITEETFTIAEALSLINQTLPKVADIVSDTMFNGYGKRVEIPRELTLDDLNSGD